MARAAIACNPDRFRGVSAEILAQLAVSLVVGTALQTLASPRSFDHTAILAALRALLLPVAGGGR
jgi:hypothetical protein